MQHLSAAQLAPDTLCCRTYKPKHSSISTHLLVTWKCNVIGHVSAQLLTAVTGSQPGSACTAPDFAAPALCLYHSKILPSSCHQTSRCCRVYHICLVTKCINHFCSRAPDTSPPIATAEATSLPATPPAAAPAPALTARLALPAAVDGAPAPAITPS